ncbi:MAG: Ankyrin repeats (3 copies) [bacterium ADurb.Bin429]|nr:MAG: Ankyrin repeats (3 copies) [bacterium ADurb.Bin429]
MSHTTHTGEHETDAASRYPPDDLIRELHHAAATGQISRVATLLAGGLSINAPDADGKTPLHHAVIAGREEMVLSLLSRSAQVNCFDRWLRTPLHEAASTGQVTIAKALLTFGADIAVRERMHQMTALHLAVLNEHAHMVAFLLSWGASPLATDIFGVTPFELARSSNQLITEQIDHWIHGPSQVDLSTRSCDTENT